MPRRREFTMTDSQTTEVDPTVARDALIARNRIGIATYPATQHELRVYHVNGILSNARLQQIERDARFKYTPKSVQGIEADSYTLQFIDELFKNRAIKGLYLEPNEITIYLRDMFYWHEAHDDVIDAIMARLGWLKEETDIMSLNDFKQLAAEYNAETVPVDKLSSAPSIFHLDPQDDDDENGDSKTGDEH